MNTAKAKVHQQNMSTEGGDAEREWGRGCQRREGWGCLTVIWQERAVVHVPREADVGAAADTCLEVQWRTVQYRRTPNMGKQHPTAVTTHYVTSRYTVQSWQVSPLMGNNQGYYPMGRNTFCHWQMTETGECLLRHL